MGTASELDVLKNNVATDLFVNMADQDYVLARIAYHKQMGNGFFWAAGQAIEKYLKASLLLNGKSSKRYGHDLVRLFEAVNEYASDLFPEKLTKPQQLSHLTHWHEETPAEFLKRIEPNTDPNNRYNLFGYLLRREDTFHLDQFIFAARRVAFQLDAYPLLGQPKYREGTPRTVREMLERFPKDQPRSHGRLDKIMKANSNQELGDAALKFNFPFAPNDYEHGEMRLGFSSANPVLYRRILALLEQEPNLSRDTDAADLAEWVMDNIKLPKDVEQELSDAAKCLRDRNLPTSNNGL